MLPDRQKKHIYLLIALVSLILVSCKDEDREISDLGTVPYVHELFIAFEDANEQNLITGMSSPKDSTRVNENDYTLLITNEYTDRAPVYDLSYITIEGKQYLDFSTLMINKKVQSNTFEFGCKHIFGNNSLHKIEAHYEPSKKNVCIRECVSITFDGKYYSTDSDSRITIRL